MGGERKVVIITGASSGIGKAAALEMLQRDWIVYGAARRVERLEELMPAGLRPLPLDVTNEKSRLQAVATVLDEAGQIDGLVNNAGYGSFGAIEDVDLDEARRQFEVNLFGLAGMCQAVLPGMRERGSGRIVNIASMGGRIYTPMGGWYYATKHAVEGFSDCLRQEVKGFGIKVSIIEPGVIASEWLEHSLASLKDTSGAGPYKELAEKIDRVMRFSYREPWVGSPKAIARVVRLALCRKNPRLRYAAALDAKVLLALRKYAPDCIFDKLVSLITNP